jgi:WD40 repeat protein
MQGHNDGEVWGLAMDDSHVYTSGDDNQVKKWDPVLRECVETSNVSDKSRKAQRNKASSMGKHPESQAARAVAVSPNGQICVCANDGSMTIRNLSDLATPIVEKIDSLEWIEVAEYSPDGAYLAVGSHDTNIYIYETTNYEQVGKATKHNATVTCLDWSMDGSYIKSVCNGYELLYYMMPGGDHDPSGRSNTTSVDWATGHAKFGWLVDGIYPKGTDGSHINGVDFNEDQSVIACGDDFGLVTTFRNPCRVGHMPRSYRGHSDHVVRARFGRGGLNQWLFSVGGYDQTLMQWKMQ